MIPIRAIALSALAVAAVATSGCSGGRDLAYKSVEAEELEKRNKELERLLDEANARNARGDIANAKAGGADGLAATKAGVGAGVGVSDRSREVVLSIENSILFRPGKAELSSQAKATLSRVIATIKEQYPDHWVRVDGHTDNEPVTRSKDQWKDNWDLAGGRAQVVLHYLLDHGLPPGDLGFAGYAEQRPLSTNSSETGRSKNRRVEIVVIPKVPGEIPAAGADEKAAPKAEHAKKAKKDVSGVK